MESFRIINDSLLVDVNDNTEDLGNGLSIDAKANSRRKIVKGRVIKTSVVTILVGELVYFPLYAGDEISLLGKDYYIVNVSDVKLVEHNYE